jgi:DNA-binding response OmpR family regulator
MQHSVEDQGARRPDRTPRILLVEDSEDLRTLMVLVLESEGYEVDAVQNAQLGLAYLNEHDYDLLLSDYALPGRSGAWLVREAIERGLVRPQCAIIITAHPSPVGTADFEVVRKPLDFEGFLGRLRELLW